MANEREKYWIAFYHTYIKDPLCNGYNLTLGGDGQSGRPMSLETRKKISDAHLGKKYGPRSEETKKKIAKAQLGRTSPNKGKKMSEEQKKKISLAHIGIRPSQETKELLRKINIGNHYAKRTAVICLETGQIFATIKSAGAFAKTAPQNISSCLAGRRKVAGGYH